MRGLRTTIALVVVLGGLVRVHLLRHLEAARRTGGGTEAGEGVRVARGRQDRGAADQVGVRATPARSRRTRTAGTSSSRWRPRRRRTPKCPALRRRSSQLEIVRVIDEKPASLNDYGLATPRIEVDFKAAGDKDFRRSSSARNRRPAAICSRSGRARTRSSSSRRSRSRRSTRRHSISATRRRFASIATRSTASRSTPAARRSSWPRRATTGSSRSRSRPRPTSPRSRASSAGCCPRR